MFSQTAPIRRSSELPCPESTLPVLGNTIDRMTKQKDRLYDWFTDESLRQGGKAWVMTVVGYTPAVMLSAPEVIQDVLRRDVDSFDKGKTTMIFQDFFGHGIIAANGHEWFTQRKTASHLFSLKTMKEVMNAAIEEKTTMLFHVLMEYASTPLAERETISLNRLLRHYTNDVFCKIGFGIDLDSLKSSIYGDEANDFMDAFCNCSKNALDRLQQPEWMWRFKRFFGIGDERVVKKDLQTVDSVVMDIISRSIERKTDLRRNQSASRTKDLISLFLESRMEGSTDDADLVGIRDMAVNFVFTGKDTTSVGIAWMIVMMNRFPHVAAKIRDELYTQLPQLFERRNQDEVYVPNLDDLKKLIYLEAALRENLRLNPPIPVSSRMALHDMTLCDGTYLERGDRVAILTYATARQPTVWGPDAADFKPERWIDPNDPKRLISVSPCKFSTFLAGPRACIGKQFAMLEMKVCLAVLLSRFEIVTVDDPWDITYEVAMTLAIKGPLKVQVRPL